MSSARMRRPYAPLSGALTEQGFRLDIQGIRGFALVLVLLAHADVSWAEGGFVGLDIFYVLSGFLITGLILKEVDRTGTVSLLRFYARRARRLLPSAVTVLGVIVIGSQLLFSPVRNDDVSRDVVAAALYFVNWHFISEEVDYFGEVDPSPVQHYWSLSVEEQFYLAWPVLFLGITWLALRAGWSPRRTAWLIVAPLGLASFLYGVGYSAASPDEAYFSTLTRGWQILLGCGLALALPAGLRMARSASALLACAGLAVFVVTTLIFDDSTHYPGWQAAFPTLATAAIIVAGTARKRSWPIDLLTRAPMQYLGRISYSWYLWHWPVVLFADAALGPLSVPEKVLATLLAWAPAAVTHHHIEERFRSSSTLARDPRRSLALGIGCTATAVLLGAGLYGLQPRLDTAPAYAVPGARDSVAGAPLQRRVSAIRPTPTDAKEDRGELWDDGCLATGKRRHSDRCLYGVPSSKTTVVLFGDSHALQYFPALLELARKHRWRLVGLVRASCPVAAVNYQPTCNAWHRNTLRRIIREERPGLVIASSATDRRFRVVRNGTRLSFSDSLPYLELGQARTLRRLHDAGVRVAVVRDQARAPSTPAKCVSRHPHDLERCAFAPKRVPLHQFDARGARRAGRPITLIDPMPVLCPKRGGARRCPAVIGNALVYRDTYHLSQTFARTLAPWLERRLPTPRRRARTRRASSVERGAAPSREDLARR